MDLANALLDHAEGRTGRTFGNTCHQHTLGPDDAPVAIEDLIHPRFLAARGTVRDLEDSIDPATADLRNLGTLPCDAYTIDEILPAVEQCIERGHWMILTFHKVNVERERLTFPIREHEALLDYCSERNVDLCVVPVREIVQTLT